MLCAGERFKSVRQEKADSAVAVEEEFAPSWRWWWIELWRANLGLICAELRSAGAGLLLSLLRGGIALLHHSNHLLAALIESGLTWLQVGKSIGANANDRLFQLTGGHVGHVGKPKSLSVCRRTRRLARRGIRRATAGRLENFFRSRL